MKRKMEPGEHPFIIQSQQEYPSTISLYLSVLHYNKKKLKVWCFYGCLISVYSWIIIAEFFKILNLILKFFYFA